MAWGGICFNICVYVIVVRAGTRMWLAKYFLDHICRGLEVEYPLLWNISINIMRYWILTIQVYNSIILFKQPTPLVYLSDIHMTSTKVLTTRGLLHTVIYCLYFCTAFSVYHAKIFSGPCRNIFCRHRWFQAWGSQIWNRNEKSAKQKQNLERGEFLVL